MQILLAFQLASLRDLPLDLSLDPLLDLRLDLSLDQLLGHGSDLPWDPKLDHALDPQSVSRLAVLDLPLGQLLVPVLAILLALLLGGRLEPAIVERYLSIQHIDLFYILSKQIF